MAERLQFVLEVDDNGSPVLRKFNANLGEADRKGKQVGRSARTAFQSVERSAASAQIKVLAMVGAIAATVGALRTMSRASTALGRSVLAAGRETENFQIQLRNVLGTTAKARVEFDRLSRLASATPFDLPQIVAAGIAIRRFGDSNRETTRAVIDLAAFMNIDAVAAAEAYGRAFAGGAGAADILRDRGVLAMVKLRTGLDDLTKLSLPEFRKVLLESMVDPTGKIAGAADRLSKSFDSLLSNLRDAWFRFRASIARAGLFEEAKRAAGDLLAEVKRLESDGTLDRIARDLNRTLVRGFKSVVDFVREIDAEKVARVAKDLVTIGTAVSRLTAAGARLGANAIGGAVAAVDIVGLAQGRSSDLQSRAAALRQQAERLGIALPTQGGTERFEDFVTRLDAAVATARGLAIAFDDAGAAAEPLMTLAPEPGSFMDFLLRSPAQARPEAGTTPLAAVAIDAKAAAKAAKELAAQLRRLDDVTSDAAVFVRDIRDETERLLDPTATVDQKFRDLRETTFDIAQAMVLAGKSIEDVTEFVADASSGIDRLEEATKRSTDGFLDLFDVASQGFDTFLDSVARGTLEFEELGESLKATFLRSLGEMFVEGLRKKVGFEGAFAANLVQFLGNLKGLITQQGSGLFDGVFGPGAQSFISGSGPGGASLGLPGLLAFAGGFGPGLTSFAAQQGASDTQTGILGTLSILSALRNAQIAQALGPGFVGPLQPGVTAGGGLFGPAAGALGIAGGLGGLGLGIFSAVNAQTDRGRASGGLSAAAGLSGAVAASASAGLLGAAAGASVVPVIGWIVAAILALAALIVQLTDDGPGRGSKQRALLRGVAHALEGNVRGGGQFAFRAAEGRIQAGTRPFGNFGNASNEAIAFGAAVSGLPHGGSSTQFAGSIARAAGVLDITKAFRVLGIGPKEAVAAINRVFAGGSKQAEIYEKAIIGVQTALLKIPEPVAIRATNRFLEDGKVRAGEFRRFVRSARESIKLLRKELTGDPATLSQRLFGAVKGRFNEQFIRQAIEPKGGGVLADVFDTIRGGFRRARRNGIVDEGEIRRIIEDMGEAFSVALPEIEQMAEVIAATNKQLELFDIAVAAAGGDIEDVKAAISAAAAEEIRLLQSVRSFIEQFEQRIAVLTDTQDPFAALTFGVELAQQQQTIAARRLLESGFGLTPGPLVDAVSERGDVTTGFIGRIFGAIEAIAGQFGDLQAGLDFIKGIESFTPGGFTPGNFPFEDITDLGTFRALEAFTDLPIDEQFTLLSQFADARLSLLEQELGLAQAQKQFWDSIEQTFQGLQDQTNVLRFGARGERGIFDRLLSEAQGLAGDLFDAEGNVNLQAVAKLGPIAQQLLQIGSTLFAPGSAAFTNLLDFLQPLFDTVLDTATVEAAAAQKEIERIEAEATAFAEAIAPLLAFLQIAAAKQADLRFESIRNALIGDSQHASVSAAIDSLRSDLQLVTGTSSSFTSSTTSSSITTGVQPISIQVAPLQVTVTGGLDPAAVAAAVADALRTDAEPRLTTAIRRAAGGRA